MLELGSQTRIAIRGTAGSFPAFLISRLGRKTLFFYDNEEEALLYKEEIEFFSGREVSFFPPRRNRIFERDDELKRIGFLYNLLKDPDFIGLFPEDEIASPYISREELLSLSRPLRCGDSIYQEDLIQYLTQSGYTSTSLVRERGEFSKRGSIVDIFSPNYEEPLRIEFMGDEIVSIRFFDPITQRSKRPVSKVEVVSTEGKSTKGGTVLDYIDEGMLLVHKGLDERVGLFGDSYLSEKWKEKSPFTLSLNVSGIQRGDEIVVNAFSNEDLKSLFTLKKNEIFKILVEKLKSEWRDIPCLYIAANSEHQAERLKEIITSYGVSLPIIENPKFDPQKREWGIIYGAIRRGFRTEEIVLLSEDELLGPKRRIVRRKTERQDAFLDSFKELDPGDFVVHIDYGIGIYRGMKELKVDGCRIDFLVLEYEGGDKLYVPVHDLHLVQKYISCENQKPKIDRLGSKSWERTKKKIRKKIEDIAGELLRIYAERMCSEGFSFSEEDEIFREMEAKFEYEETEGQREAINDVLSDMKSPKPMDRLLCGDAGFGKTEVALRAAFKAVLDGKQVAILVPTTVLAQQHFKTFTERLSDYPVNIEVLSRFKSKEEQKRIVKMVRDGTVDILIGTHRILQDDVKFKDLGLLVIDEEQRFGVRHKEKLKLMKKNVDVLSISATPIPRTLYMALTGIKDLSIIDTPPLDRLAVKTYVMKFDEEVIKKGILNELGRGGQVFFVHNYIYNIEEVGAYLKRLVPQVKIAIAHGRMRESQLERIMIDFIDRKYDLLLSTNIIESGLDISNVNTIFINNAHKMGLSDLYQLRGRVGRGPRQAYAYLLIPPDAVLTREAMLRLKVIEEMNQVGSGFYIANYDLQIRGCGNLLGKEQSGNVNSVGFELYLSMLENAIRELKGERRDEEEEIFPQISIPVEAYIPEWYVADSSQRLFLYKRMAKIMSEEELKEVEEEIADRYGMIPNPVKNLLRILDLRIFLSKIKVKRLEKTEKGLLIHLTEKTPIDSQKLLKLALESGIKLIPENKILVKLNVEPVDLIELSRIVLLNLISL